MNRKAVITVVVFCGIIILSGFTIITAGLPKFIKDKSDFKINYTPSPFDFSVDVGNYSLSVNDKIGNNFKNGSQKIINVIGGKIHSGTSYIIDTTQGAFQNIENRFKK
ncbi:hypothetical protein ACYUJ6_04560 [Clostridium sp. JNZ X4-2]